jgi:ABC-type multidrug transport system fused ATPase/permease subunit
MVRMLAELWKRLPRVRKRQFFILLALMLAASFAEVVSIGAILPFLGVLTAPQKVISYPPLQPLIHWLGVVEAQQLLLPLTLIFCAAALVAGAIRILLVYATTKYSYAVGADISIDVYRRTLFQPYPMHIARNSSEVINAITGKTAMVIGSVFVPLMTLASSVVILSGVVLALVAVDPMIVLLAGGLFGGIYLVIVRLSKRKLRENSECIARESTQVIKSLQEGLGGIRDVLIDGTQELYCQIYRSADRPLRQAQGNTIFLSSSPRYLIETLGLVLVAGLAYSMSQRPEGVATAIPVLGALALGAQRLLPVLQQGYSSYVIMRGAEASLGDTLALLDQPLPDQVAEPAKAPLPFASTIELKQLGFRYGPQLPWVLRGVDLEIRRGSRVGFIGTTGIGKSTLFDVIMGLLPPTEGILAIDGVPVTLRNQRAWQAHLAHVPQNVYLADTSIAENIAFGVPRDLIDFDRVREAARGAQIAQTIEDLPEQYRTPVGERGARLSGGQRQRIGIARALYKKADVIILDEATSALDHETERAVMKSIHELSPDITLLIIAHRLSTLKDCDAIVELGRGGIRRMGTYGNIVAAELTT